eukprot:TRINITY_DN7008_c0_g1_i1.p1 TRINITY_DN7008_c0_g1~~TRINITY_DN7008_c0_g1_i1.p1  ORF type:complete len:317 (-),score=52.64 TRINITY_DN7008_c0_g1_i1:467-1417(-)
MPTAPQRSRRIRRTIAYSDDSKSQDPSSRRSFDALLSDASYADASSGHGNSYSSLGKRLASVVLSSGSGPKDFGFLFKEDQPPEKVLKTSASDCVSSGTSAAPEVIRDDDDDVSWFRTDIRRGSDLVDGKSWMQSFRESLANSADKTNFAKNRILRDLAKVCPPGRKVKLATGQEVIFWFNVGRPGPMRERVYVTEAKCPHQGVCLLTGELGEIEDAAGVAHGVVRCPRHNKTFHLQTGHSQGNREILKTYPCKFKHGFWYVGVDNQELTESPKHAEASAKKKARSIDETQEGDIDVRSKLRVVLDAVGWREELRA